MARGKLNRGHQLSRQIRVGIVLVIALVFLAYGVYQVGRLFDVFAERYPLVTLVESSGGLIEGAPVTLAGQRIGQVDEIRFIPVEERTAGNNIHIGMSLSEGVSAQIRADSRASLRTQGLLGDRFVDITPGSARYPALGPGDTIPSMEALDYDEVLQTAATTMEQVRDVVVDLRTMTDRLVGGKGTLGSLLADDRLYERMTAASAELAGLLREVDRADGTLGRLIRDPEMYGRMNQTLARLDSLGAVVLDGQGTLGRLVRDDTLYERLLAVVGSADSAVAGVQGFVDGVNTSDGTLARLLEDPALYDQFLRAVVDLQNLIEAVRADPKAFVPPVTVDVF